MKTLYVSDLDGTLLNRESRLSAATLGILNRLIEEGMRFTFATARSMESSMKVTGGLLRRYPVVAYNGAVLYDSLGTTRLDTQLFLPEQRQQVRKDMKRFRLSPIVYAFVNGKESVSFLPQKINTGTWNYIDSRRGDKRLRPVFTEDELYDGEVFYYTAIGTRGELSGLQEQYREKAGFRCTFQKELYESEDYWCEIMSSESTKALGIRRLMKYLECDRIVSFGDMSNDLPMFRISDESYAVENAEAELKREATGVIASNEQDGVARWLQKYWNREEESRT